MTDLIGYSTSFTGMFAGSFGSESISAITIPQIQRDYAQGRPSDDVRKIRADYLGQLVAAAKGDLPDGLDLDFVYGTIDAGVLSPLDGQQRLTSLFLLHWVSAVRAGKDPATMPWSNFSYATRDSARRFTERLVRHSAGAQGHSHESVSVWIRDQPWYLFEWNHDPTVQSMLVVLDDLEAHFAETDPDEVWHRLSDVEPVIRFHLLPLPGPESDSDQRVINGDQLYIKMNSRGKPLTDFENFKAVFEKALTGVPTADQQEPASKRFSRSVDGPWSDLLFPYRGKDNVIDDEFLRYMTFIIDICEWLEGLPSEEDAGVVRLEARAHRTFVTSSSAELNRDFLFFAFDTWANESPSTFFDQILTTGPTDDDRVRLFAPAADADLFARACRLYGERSSNSRRFSLADTLLFYALLVHRREQTTDLLNRVRQLRNLLIDADQTVRTDRMPSLLHEVGRFVTTGDLQQLATLTRFRRDDELLKQELLQSHPDLRAELVRLENHPLLEGCLFAFDLEPGRFASRANTFVRSFDLNHWPLLTGALLTHGEYQRQASWGADHFGSRSSREAWRNILTHGGRKRLSRTRAVLTSFLDALDSLPEGEIHVALQGMIDEFVSGCSDRQIFPWRYYLVKYPELRDGASGYFAREQGSMFQSVALRRKQLNSLYRDTYLYAAETASDTLDDDGWRYTGYTRNQRWLDLPDGTRVRARDCGLEVDATSTAAPVEGLVPLVQRGSSPAPDDGSVGIQIAGIEVDGEWLDTEDRVERFAAFIRGRQAHEADPTQ